VNTPIDTTPPRYTDRKFPDYGFIPGKSPHPTRDADGHSYNKPMETLAAFDADNWQSCEVYLYGIDLFNHGYWWEAHEALEPVWLAAGKETETGLFVQGLIQIAVANLKNAQGATDVAQRMAKTGLDKMRRREGIYLGIDVRRFCTEVKTFFETDDQTPVLIELVMAKKESTGAVGPGVTSILSRLKSLISR
jgi:hypothetical protein